MQSSNFVSDDNGGQIQMELYSFDDLNEVEAHKPGVTVQSFSSKGQMSRVYCKTTGRLHTCMSKLEHVTHVVVDQNPRIIDIKDQYTHDLRLSLEVAVALGTNHPPQKEKIKEPLTTDLLVEFIGKNGASNRIVGIYVKYVKDLRGAHNYRNAEKLQLERKSLAELGIQTFVVTEKTFDKTTLENILWMLTVSEDQLAGEANSEYAKELLLEIHKTPDEKLSTSLIKLDEAQGEEHGFHLTEVKCLLQLGLLSFELTKNFTYLTCADVELGIEVYDV